MSVRQTCCGGEVSLGIGAVSAHIEVVWRCQLAISSL